MVQIHSSVCPDCGIVTRDLGRHKRRKRCSYQHIRAKERGK